MLDRKCDRARAFPRMLGRLLPKRKHMIVSGELTRATRPLK